MESGLEAAAAAAALGLAELDSGSEPVGRGSLAAGEPAVRLYVRAHFEIESWCRFGSSYHRWGRHRSRSGSFRCWSRRCSSLCADSSSSPPSSASYKR